MTTPTPANPLIPDLDTFAGEPRTVPYTFSTTVAKLLAQHTHCAWAAWLRTHYSHHRLPGDAGAARWQINHAAMQASEHQRLEDDGFTVTVGNQNLWQIRNAQGAILAGKPNLVGRRALEDGAVDTLIVNLYPHEPRHADVLDTLLSMYAIHHRNPADKPRARLVYPGGEQQLAHDDLVADLSGLRSALQQLMQRLLDPDNPPPRTPSYVECKFCDIAPATCPERVTQDPNEETHAAA